MLFLSLKENIWSAATNLLRTSIGEPPLNLLLWHLLLVFLLIPLAFSLSIKFNVWRTKSRPYRFIELDGFAWRVRKDINEVKDFPFCIEHRAEYIPKRVYSDFDHRNHDIYLCPICGDKYTRGITRQNLSDIYERVKKIVEAQFFNYGRNVK